MSIKEASYITEIGYENAKAIKRFFISNSVSSENKKEDRKSQLVCNISKNLKPISPDVKASIETNVSSKVEEIQQNKDSEKLTVSKDSSLSLET
jgi:hypothetical protein